MIDDELSVVDDVINNQLEEDEIELLEELIDKFELYIEFGLPIFVILVPLFVFWLRARFLYS